MEDNETCSRCGRKLKKPKNRELGYGPVCYAKMMAEKELAQKQRKEDQVERN